MNTDPSGGAFPRPGRQPTPRHRYSRRLAAVLLADALRRSWVALLLRGIVAIALGVLALLLARTGVAPLSWPFGLYALVDGVLGLGIVLGENSGRPYWLVLLFRALIGIAVGILVLVTRVTLLSFLWYIAVWLTSAGVLDLLTAHFLRGKLGGEWFLRIGGTVAGVSGLIFLPVWGVGQPLLGRVIAANALLLGGLLVILAFRARAAQLR